MAVEPKRGCGFRKIGGLYLVGTGITLPCDRLNFNLEVCSVCGQGIKQTMGFTWIDWHEFAGKHKKCKCLGKCPVCNPKEKRKHGLLWVGKKFYSPRTFIEESWKHGVSKRIPFVPKELKIGETWVLLAHPEAGEKEIDAKNTLTGNKKIKVPAIFYAFKPAKIEKIVTKVEFKDRKKMDELKKRGITPVPVPDDDPDHKGSVYKKIKQGD